MEKKSMNQNNKELKNFRISESKNSGIKEEKNLESKEFKVFIYDDPYIKYNDVVDAAIRFFYDYKKKQ